MEQNVGFPAAVFTRKDLKNTAGHFGMAEQLVDAFVDALMPNAHSHHSFDGWKPLGKPDEGTQRTRSRFFHRAGSTVDILIRIANEARPRTMWWRGFCARRKRDTCVEGRER